MSTSVQADLAPQASLLGQSEMVVGLSRMASGQAVADELRRHMIRHTKSMRIDGGEALVLKKAEVHTEWLPMGDRERQAHARSVCIDSMHSNLARARSVTEVAAAISPLSRALAVPSLDVTPGNDVAKLARRAKATKNAWLAQELRRLSEEAPGVHALIFTHYAAVQQALVRHLQMVLPPDAWLVSSFSADTRAIERHNIIRQFQMDDEPPPPLPPRPPSSSKAAGKRKADGAMAHGSGRAPQGQARSKVLVATFDVAAVGITLTKAQVVFMMEPTVDPSTAAQAAGRVHRLGQRHDVRIVQLAYRDSLDAALIEIHDGVRNGTLSLRNGPSGGEHGFSTAKVHSVLTKWGCGIKHDLKMRDEQDRDHWGRARVRTYESCSTCDYACLMHTK
jgi:hypothetical protein